MDEEIGILAEVVFDEIIEILGIQENQLARPWAGKFVRVLDQRLPRDIENRQAMIRNVGNLLIQAR